MVEKLLKTLAVTLHFGIDWQSFSCAYSCNAVFSEALLLPQILQEFCYCWVSESHAQLEGSSVWSEGKLLVFWLPFRAFSK